METLTRTTAQDLINQVTREDRKKKESRKFFLKTFFPVLYLQEQADENITLILSQLKGDKQLNKWRTKTNGKRRETNR